MKKPILYIDMDGVLCDFGSMHVLKKAENPGIKYPQSQYKFFKSLEPIQDAIVTYKKLEEFYDVRILTAPSHKNRLCYTEKAQWVYDHLGEEAQRKMTITKFKGECRGSILVDDSLENGAKEFGEYEGQEHIHFGTAIYPNWVTVYIELVTERGLDF